MEMKLEYKNYEGNTTFSTKIRHTPWILLPVTGHLGPLALFLVVWYTSFPPKHPKQPSETAQTIELTQIKQNPQIKTPS